MNVVAGREVAPEFVQDALEPGAMAAALSPLLAGGAERDRMQSGLAAVRAQLGAPGAAMRVAEMVSALAS